MEIEKYVQSEDMQLLQFVSATATTWIIYYSLTLKPQEYLPTKSNKLSSFAACRWATKLRPHRQMILMAIKWKVCLSKKPFE